MLSRLFLQAHQLAIERELNVPLN
uniref:Uncharacterized protein n=1 Tax=Anguilla anguilla TaxID=7936 RepID=A0A0E9RSQ1_ANGAN